MYLIECIDDNSYCIVEDEYVYGDGKIEEHSVVHFDWNGRSHEGVVKMKSGKQKYNFYMCTHVLSFLMLNNICVIDFS